jgi:hypothetical protein
MATTTTARLSDEDLRQMLALVRGADSVELKLTIHESARADAARALGVDPLDSQIRQVFFFDTPELALNAAGVVVRARRRQDEEGDTVVKLARSSRITCPRTCAPWRPSTSRWTRCRGGSCARRRSRVRRTTRAIREAASGDLPIRKLFTKEQRAFYEAHAPDGIELDTLSDPGPDPDHQGEGHTGGLRPQAGRRALDVSRRVADRRAVDQGEPDEAFQVAAEARAFLLSLGVDLTGEQQTKTKTALEFFAGAKQTA